MDSRDGSAAFPIAIIGAGFAGIAAAIRLQQEGIRSFTMFERADDVGGTWRDNTYPGAACDVQSHVYSLSFEPNPRWSRRYAPSWEIHEYLVGLVDKHGLRRHLRLGTEIVKAELDEARGLWVLTTGGGDAFEARVVLSGVGGLVNPAYPDIAGVDDFAGPVMHTARWDHGVELAGKRVAVIGTGASAVQVVPSIAPDVAELTVFQRTAAWVVPKADRPYPEAVRQRMARHPALLRASRLAKYALSEVLGPVVFMDSRAFSAIGTKLSMWHLHRQVKDPDLRAKLTPKFQFGCKRVLVSDDYWATFERDDVELVTERIEAIREDGIETVDGKRRPFDVIVLATGFQVGICAAPFEIVGRGGRTLSDAWRDGAYAYKGMTVSGFPNLFMMMGPNTGPGHTSVLIYTEAQVSHALAAIQRMRRDRIKLLDVRQDVLDRYNASIQGRMKHMSWASGCKSWYLSPDGTNRTLYPGFAAEYVLRARRLRLSDYRIVPF